MGVTGIELGSVTGIARNDLGQQAVLLLPESMPSEVVISPEVWESLPEHVRELIRGKTK